MDWQEQLSTPINNQDVGLTDQERQQIYNLARGQQQGAWGAGINTLKQQLGKSGLTVGESGLADTALGGMLQGQTQALGDQSTQIAINEANQRSAQKEALTGLQTTRATSLGDLMSRMAASASAAGTSANELAWEKEKFGEQFQYQQQQDALNQLYSLYGSQNQNQQDVYAPYYNAING